MSKSTESPGPARRFIFTEKGGEVLADSDSGEDDFLSDSDEELNYADPRLSNDDNESDSYILPEDVSETADFVKASRVPNVSPFTEPEKVGPAGLAKDIGDSAIDHFKLFFTDELVQKIVDETNLYATQYFASQDLSPGRRANCNSNFLN